MQQAEEAIRQWPLEGPPFRQEVYQVFGSSRDAAFEVIDAMAPRRATFASSPYARSAAEVSTSPLMHSPSNGPLAWICKCV